MIGNKNAYIHFPIGQINCVGNLDPPIIQRHPKPMMVNLENNATMVSLQCEARGATSYNWERRYGSIPSDATGVSTNILTIFNLQIEDAGDYRCVAINDKGQRFLNILGFL